MSVSLLNTGSGAGWIFMVGLIACFSKMAKHTVGAFLVLSGLCWGQGAAFILGILKECHPAAISAARGIDASVL